MQQQEQLINTKHKQQEFVVLGLVFPLRPVNSDFPLVIFQ